jgi:hypothetical protein
MANQQDTSSYSHDYRYPAASGRHAARIVSMNSLMAFNLPPITPTGVFNPGLRASFRSPWTAAQRHHPRELQTRQMIPCGGIFFASILALYSVRRDASNSDRFQHGVISAPATKGRWRICGVSYLFEYITRWQPRKGNHSAICISRQLHLEQLVGMHFLNFKCRIRTAKSELQWSEILQKCRPHRRPIRLLLPHGVHVAEANHRMPWRNSSRFVETWNRGK